MSKSVPGEYKIRDITISPGLVLAPMSGVTTASFRRLIKELNPGAVGLVMTEFVSVEGLTRMVRRSLEMIRLYPEENPVAIQVFGYDIERMKGAALMAEEAGADIVDINCGCPAPKVVKKGGGCELMRQPLHLAKIIREVKKVLTVPLTIKIRSGWDEGSLNAMEIGKIAQEEGAEGITVHGRTRKQLYRGEADWNVVAELAENLSIPVLGSGDVTDYASAAARLSSNVSGLFIGRAAIYNPLVFSEIVEASRNPLSSNTLKLRDDPLKMLTIIERYTELLREEFPTLRCIGKIKQLVSQMCKGHDWRKPLCRANTLEEQRIILDQLREELDKKSGHTLAA